MKLAPLLARWGFDTARLQFTLRTALACCLAVLVAWLLGLEHPHWAGMTVWAASMPVRDHMMEKSFFRILGTIVGTLVGVLLVALVGQQPWWLVIGLAVWLGLCSGLGNLQRSFVSYGTMLAGYSAVMVAMLGTPSPDHLFSLGADRLLTALLGVVAALAVGWFYAQWQTTVPVAERLRQLSGDILDHMAKRLSGEPAQPAHATEAMLSEIADIDESLDPLGTGSVRARQSIRPLRAMLSSQVSALLWLKRNQTVQPDEVLAAQLKRAALALRSSDPLPSTPSAMARAIELSAGQTSLNDALRNLQAALEGLFSAPDTQTPVRPRAAVLHLDWVGAAQAMLRAAVTILIIGLIWVTTGWSGGPYMMIGASVMISIFSAFDNPAKMMRTVVLRGQVLGVIAALACHWLVWPFAQSELGMVLLMMPFILSGGLVAGYRRTMASSYDYNMIMLILLQPVYPLSGTFAGSLGNAIAVLLAPVVAYVAFRLIYPPTARNRMNTLIGVMLRELQGMASDHIAPARQEVLRRRLYHRLLKLVRWIDKAGEHRISALGGSLAVLDLGDVALRAQQLLHEPDITPATARRLQATLRRISNVRQEPQRVVRALELAATQLARESRQEAALLRVAARSMADNQAFFERPQNAAASLG
ncbi:FUSC family protein [Eoetvoesiella caeni]|uniref:Putative membrane protein YccC n=1 Tax=Eoetvoesiella caeni TaxID=645616 RepID=A0A366H1H6_9BURK|nr:FUSC family protein [Eoetvoesiella caeni]MCI2810853.1 FUSC family protein [Eoetvoesiella caeni]NYT56751.1 FUSC family protein [Eoetvoesiella caeni]RBP35741.1 putative membrane protein YccC [Eoetvoesiella caeni]